MERKLIEPIQYIRYDNCPNCHRNTIELFSYDNYPMHYSEAVLSYMNGDKSIQYNKYSIYRMRCRGCGKIYNIVWRDEFPVPLLEQPENRSINIFLSLYHQDHLNSGNNIDKKIFNDIL